MSARIEMQTVYGISDGGGPPTLESQLETHRIKSRPPRGEVDPHRYTVITDTEELKNFSEDAAHVRGSTSEAIRLKPEAGEAEVAYILKRSPSVLTQGARSSLTGGATPEGSIVIDMSYQDKILEIGEDSVTVQPGVTVHALQENLAEKELYYPPGPTFDGANVGGIIATNAAGAATFKYGQTRPWVEELTVILANGEVVDMKRGQYRAHKDGYFEWENADGKIQRIPIPTYIMPDVPKISAGYYAKPDMDFIDLFIGSEGTLGVITKAKLRIVPKPHISWAIVSCQSEDQALELTRRLRDQSLETRKTGDPSGIDASAIEYIDEHAVEVLREDSTTREAITPPEEAKTLLLIQLENIRTDSDLPLERFAVILDDMGLSNNTQIAFPSNGDKIKYFKDIREAVPSGVNGRVGQNKKNIDSRISKMAGDMIVPFERLGEMLQIFREKFAAYGLEYYNWGHFSDGNTHPNVVAKSYGEILAAKQAILEIGREVIKLGGSPLAEHGVGKNPIKQQLLEELYGKEGIEQMRAVKEALDPEWKLAPGNLFLKAPSAGIEPT
ncbi:FAD-binding oxidoreductase [Candidatus Gottesmanbacteria bacterium]|nr:FAD-binding oxidoreductase [Candidatus Gottesmanbacteria bacterium]